MLLHLKCPSFLHLSSYFILHTSYFLLLLVGCSRFDKTEDYATYNFQAMSFEEPISSDAATSRGHYHLVRMADGRFMRADWLDDGQTRRSSMSFTYDQKGTLTGLANLDPAGKMLSFWIWHLDASGRMVQAELFAADRSLLQSMRFTYTTEGFPATETTRPPSGKLARQKVYFQAPDGLPDSIRILGGDSVCIGVTVLTRNAERRVVHTEERDGEGKTLTILEYRYHAGGSISEEIRSTPGGEPSVTRYSPEGQRLTR